MELYDIESYGENIAAVYDEWYAAYDVRMIDGLSELARGGRALELGIGTGRIALPLQERGVEVHGIDASESMLAKLRSKSGGENIPVRIGDFAQVDVEGRFDLIYIVFNTFFALLTQEEQINCFRNVAAHLKDEGIFLLEVFVPDLKRFESGQTLRVVSLGEGLVRLEASIVDPALQQVTSHHIALGEAGTRFYPLKIRYAWPSELDLMARLAGLTLKERWGGWDRSAFRGESMTHISLYANR